MQTEQTGDFQAVVLDKRNHRRTVPIDADRCDDAQQRAERLAKCRNWQLEAVVSDE